MVNLKNLIRIGTVSSINYAKGTIRICLEDQDSVVTDELPMLSFEYEMPNVDDPVLCLFLGNGITNGFCLGRYFYADDQPNPNGADIYCKRFLRQARLVYDRSSKTLTLSIPDSNDMNVVIDGNLSITGELTVTGNAAVGKDLTVTGDGTISGALTVQGDAKIGGKSFLNHIHQTSNGPSGPPQ
jgi:phage baseplate assembly protein V